MNNIYNYIGILLLSVWCLTACSEFDAINTNPDTPSEASESLIATRMIYNMAGPDDCKAMSRIFLQGKYIGWSESAMDEQYNYQTRGSFSGYNILTNGPKMIAYTVGLSQENSYRGLYSFLKAYKIFYISMKMGDVPYSDALNGEEGNVKPTYDTQKEVMIQVLDELDAAYNYFNTSEKDFDGDIIYKGSRAQWKKAISVFQLKVLLFLSGKESDPDLNVKERFANIVTNRPLFESNMDNFQLVFKNQSGMINRYHKDQTKHAPFILMSSMLTDSMKKYNDYRLFHHAEPAPFKIAAGVAASDWDAYMGIDLDLPFNEMTNLEAEGKACKLNERFRIREEGEPLYKLSYSDMNFMLAEGALRGWTTASTASAYYLKGIEAGLRFTKDVTPADNKYTHGREITEEYIQSQLVLPIMQLTGSFERDLNMILTQRFLSGFLQIYEADVYFNYRRTGYPAFSINPATNQNPMSDRLPIRYMYPTKELNSNREHVEEAIKRQFNGNDNVNEKMWILE